MATWELIFLSLSCKTSQIHKSGACVFFFKAEIEGERTHANKVGMVENIERLQSICH